MVSREAPQFVRRDADLDPPQAGRRHVRFGWAGIALGAGAWAINTQANLTLTPFACAGKTHWPIFVSAGMAVVALLGAIISAAVWFRAGGLPRYRERGDGRPGLFLAGLGVLAGVLFAIVILSQGAANLFLMGCER